MVAPALSPAEALLTDEQLLFRFRDDGDEEAFAALVRRYERRLFGFLRRRLRSTELAEDVFQCTFLRVHLKCDDFEAGRPFRPWLFAIATRQAIDALRRCSRQRLVSLERFRDEDGEDGGDPLAEMAMAPHCCVAARIDAEETSARVRVAMDGLSPAHRHVVTLVYYEGAKYRDVARILGIPLGTVKSRLHAALRALAVAWAGV